GEKGARAGASQGGRRPRGRLTGARFLGTGHLPFGPRSLRAARFVFRCLCPYIGVADVACERNRRLRASLPPFKHLSPRRAFRARAISSYERNRSWLSAP